MKKTTLILCLLICSLFVNAQDSIYSEVKVDINSPSTLDSLMELGFDIDHYQGNTIEGIRFFVTPLELQKLEDNNFTFEVTIADFSSYYAAQLAADKLLQPNPVKPKNVAQGFDLGTMGGFYTFSEIEGKLDEMKADYPDIISSKASIGTSVEGRPIWMIKISDNPEIDEPEPAAHFDALHHAREPLSMATTINYMFWLLENYDTNPQVKFLVDNRELYFVPVVNPDGYVYNESTNPNGGGLWRKNRKQVNSSCFGIDLNRNYGYEFGTNNSCSSSDPCSQIYRGDAAFSEPETVAIRDFLALTQPKTAFTTHSTAGTYLMPYGFNTSPPAFDIYSEWASAFLNENDYTYGTTFQMLGYTSCGTTRDYFHSEEIYGWTPEIGGSGFWPLPSTIFDIVAENIRPFLYQSYIAGSYLDVQSYSILGDVEIGETFQLVVNVKNVGVGSTATNVSVLAQANAIGVTSPSEINFDDIPAREIANNSLQPFQFTIDPSFTEEFFTITVTTFQDGAANETFEVPVFVGNKELLFYDDAASGDQNWTPSGNGIQWGLNEDDSFSGDVCFGDSNDGNSQDNTTNFYVLNEIFNFSNIDFPIVQFAYKHALEEGDSASFDISTNNGTSWEKLKNYYQNESWSIETFELGAYKGFDEVRFRFSLKTDGSIPGDGFYFDDFEVANYAFGILQISENDFGTATTIYPNPFTKSLVIESSESIPNLEIRLLDILGKELNFDLEERDSNWEITNLASLKQGVYFLVLKNPTSGQESVRRVIKR